MNDFIENGVPVFIKEAENFKYKSLETNRKRKLKPNKVKIEYPETPDTKCPMGFREERLKTKAEIILYNKDIEKIMDEILEDHLEITEEDGDSIKPIALFFVDPCGSVSWNKVILKICERSQNRQGTGMALNWSWEAIARNLKTDAKDSMLSEIYGISIEEVSHEFKEIREMDEYLEKYLEQLRLYFKYVEVQGVPRDRKLRPKLSKYRKYFLILCTNNRSALSIAGHKKKKIQKGLRDNFIDISKLI